MTIFPLPIFERDEDPAYRDARTDAEAYARLKPPSSIVVRFGSMKLVGEYPYDGDAKPGCGSKLVVKTHRGTELAEMLTSTCPNSGCSKSVSRREMLEYVENSGGKDYPFHTQGRVLRVATPEDMAAWTTLRESFRKGELAAVRTRAAAMGMTMKIVEVEPVLGGEYVAVHYLSEERVDFRELVPALARRFGARVEMHQIGARDEARLTADYEKCGQHCCCKNFLKVLKPVSMRSAKVQKASLDPLKISGRCGRLMCCLRYEDETYDELKKRLPHRKTRVGTSEGPGIVVDSK
ncbi:MAG: stage 0 sporulation family protein, partial [Phycisphaerales bacterium]